MKKVLFTIMVSAILLTGCGGGSGSVSSTNAEISGNIQNNGVMAALSRGLYRTIDFAFGTAFAVPVDSVNSLLSGLDSPIVIPAVSAGELMMIQTTVQNRGPGVLSGATLEIEIEHVAFITKEYWGCMKCYSYNSGEACNQIWQVDGGTIIAPVDAPPLPQCDTVNETGVNGYCLDTFDAGLDCTSATWRVEYQKAGDGLFRATGVVPDLAAGQTNNSSAGISMEQAGNIRSGHYARWKVIASDGVTVLDKKDYIFDVIN